MNWERASYDWSTDSKRIIATPSQWARATLYYVQEIGDFRTYPSYFTERQGLDSYLLVYTMAGTGTLHYQQKEYHIHPGDLFYIDCKEYQYYASTGTSPWEFLWVHWNGSASQGYYHHFKETHMRPVCKLPHDSRIPDLLRNLLALQEEKSIQVELLSAQLLIQLMTELLLQVKTIGHSSHGQPPYIDTMIQRFKHDYPKRIGLEQLAMECAMNKFHMAKQFKRYTGYSPGEFLIQIRMTEAKRLLKESELTIAEIAEAVGIEYVSHFIHLFKQREHMTPLQYRRQWW